MTNLTDKMSGKEKAKRSSPGCLMYPFGWAAEPLAKMGEAEPELYSELFEIDRFRMHLIALALAHLDHDVPPQFGLFLVRGSLREILDQVLGRCPVGIQRALAHLPYSVLMRVSYRQLVELLDDRVSAKLLYHFDTIEESALKLLHEMPRPLRRPIMMEIFGGHSKLEGLLDGLHYLASRGAAKDFDTMVAELATVNHPGQFVGHLRRFTDAIPLPEVMPPAQVEHARRLDRVMEVCALAKRWKNCLANFTDQIDLGECAVYLWEDREDARKSAVCLVRRHGRYGWFLEDVKGPSNSNIEPERLKQIRQAFADSNIPLGSVIDAIETIIEDEPTLNHRQLMAIEAAEQEEREIEF